MSGVVALGSPGPARAAALERVRAAAAPFGGRVEMLADGTLVAGLAARGSARDQARQAARCALAVRDVLEDDAIALATARASEGAAGALGDVIASAVELVRQRPPKPEAPRDAPRRQRPIAIDAITAGLLDARFDVGGDDANLALRRERTSADPEAPRTLLGKPTPFVGRDRELTTLEAIFRQCVEERVAHAVLVTAPSGVGKSRLRHELVARVRERGDGAEVWVARGDPMSTGSPFGMLAQLVRARRRRARRRAAPHAAGEARRAPRAAPRRAGARAGHGVPRRARGHPLPGGEEPGAAAPRAGARSSWATRCAARGRRSSPPSARRSRCSSCSRTCTGAICRP